MLVCVMYNDIFVIIYILYMLYIIIYIYKIYVYIYITNRISSMQKTAQVYCEFNNLLRMQNKPTYRYIAGSIR